LHRPGYRRPDRSTEPLSGDAGFARFIPLPENRSALAALQQLAHDMDESANPLFLHGPAGSGKSCLVAAVAEELVGLTICTLSANAFPLPWDQDGATAADRHEQARSCDLLIVEDLHHLPARATETLVALLDERLQRRLPTVFTANAGPAQLAHRGEALPVRLTNRLASGLVVALEPLQAPSRRVFLLEIANRRALPITAEVLDWLAEMLTGGGRQLEGAINQLETLATISRDAQRSAGHALPLREVREQFQQQAQAGLPTMERIVRRVSDYYRVQPRQLGSGRRQRSLLLARQVSMYLARRLTPMSLQEIGACFGGRDHTTVLHACRKVEEAMKCDASLSGAVHQLHAEFV
jgi:chromosomal replication initiator protein